MTNGPPLPPYHGRNLLRKLVVGLQKGQGSSPATSQLRGVGAFAGCSAGLSLDSLVAMTVQHALIDILPC